MRSRALVLLFVCASLAGSGTASAQNSYRKLVDDYRRYGASAASRAATLTDDDIAAGRHELAGSWEELRAAAMLHTEAVLVLANDGQLAATTRHLDAAVSLLDDVIRVSPAQQDFAYRWYTLTERLLRQFRASASANGLARNMKDRFSSDFLARRGRFDDAVLFELQGCLNGYALSAVPAGRSASAVLLPRWFNPAARIFEDLLKANPAILAASLHLGRMAMVQGHLDDARAHFERAMSDGDPRVRYLATLFIASIDEGAGRLPDAERRYREALTSYGWGQAAHLALANLLSRTGREAEARKLLADRFSDRSVRIIEPLWTYLAGPDDEFGARFDELRAEVWR